MRALRSFAEKLGVKLPIVDATLNINEAQPIKVVQLGEELAGNLRGKRVAVLGLAFKPNTDDVREAVSVKIINELLRRGADVVAYDPAALNNAKPLLGMRVTYASSVHKCLQRADLAILVTEWDEFRELSPKDFKGLMKTPAIVEGRRIFDAHKFIANGVAFKAVGLGKS